MSKYALTAMKFLAESFLGALLGKAFDHAIQKYCEQRGAGNDLKQLQNSLGDGNQIINTIEGSRIKDKDLQHILKDLLIQLKDAAYDADDLFNDFQNRILKKQIEQQGGDGAGNRASSSSYSIPLPSKKLKISSYNSVLFGKGDDDDDDDDALKMRKIRKKLDDILVAIEKIYSWAGAEDDRGNIQLLSSASQRTSSFLTEPQLFGRDKDLQELKDLLLKPEVASDQSGVSVLSIAGISGIGKTTLAQEVFNDSSVEEYFKLRIWIRVSENFCTDSLTREIIRYATKKKCDLTNFANLQEVLKEKITPERFLLVLEDVWNEDMHKWESFCAPLRSGKPGSKILLTTCSRKIVDMVGNVDVIHLEGLDEKSFWDFFKKCAFVSSNTGVHHFHLEAMAKKMICMLKGSPLAAKILGGLLSMKLDEQHWKSILDSEIWQLSQEENEIMPMLQLSYQYLPPHLKKCFTFCSLFPKNYKFSESELISLWMAEGFIDDPQESIRMEELGSNYFHELVSRSFFQKSKDKKFIMHDLIHDLAELLSAGESYRIEKGKSHEIRNTIRHLSMHEEAEGMQTRRLTEFSHYNKLRTLMLSRRYTSNSFLVDCGTLERLKNIRVLIWNNCALKVLPNGIGMLIHLRYLDLSHNHDIRRLPESLCDLYNLQTLILYGCDNLENLPHGIMKLINLRKLDGADKFISEITEVGKLTSLQNLSAFKVLKDNGHRLVELNGLKQLRGGLHITKLENVENKHEANIASLKSKEHLDRLELEWTSSQESDTDVNLHISEQVLEGLQPHHNLQSLTITGYNGARPPNWLHEQVYSRLECLHLKNCKRWNDLSVEPLLNLNYLTIHNCHELRWLGIKSLQLLTITRCPKLLLSQGEGQTEKSSLRELVIDDTAFMQQSLIKNLLSSVEHLTISFSCKAVIFEGGDQESLQSLTSLHSLCFSCCKNLQSLPTKLYTLTSLQSLHIYDCPQIQFLPEKGLPPSLTNLDFEGCNLALEQQLRNHLVEIKKSHRYHHH